MTFKWPCGAWVLNPVHLPSSVVSFAHVFTEIATFCLKCIIITMNWSVRKRKRKDEKNIRALAGNRTRVNCLEGIYAHHYTTNASRRSTGKVLVNEYLLRITWTGLRNSEEQGAGPWNRTTNNKFSGRFFFFCNRQTPLFKDFFILTFTRSPWVMGSCFYWIIFEILKA